MSKLLVIFVSFCFFVCTTYGFCFHQYGGEGEYHKKCDSSVGKVFYHYFHQKILFHMIIFVSSVSGKIISFHFEQSYKR